MPEDQGLLDQLQARADQYQQLGDGRQGQLVELLPAEVGHPPPRLQAPGERPAAQLDARRHRHPERRQGLVPHAEDAAAVLQRKRAAQPAHLQRRRRHLYQHRKSARGDAVQRGLDGELDRLQPALQLDLLHQPEHAPGERARARQRCQQEERLLPGMQRRILGALLRRPRPRRPRDLRRPQRLGPAAGLLQQHHVDSHLRGAERHRSARARHGR